VQGRPKQIVIGIDAGKNTGLVIYDRIAKKIIHHRTTDFFGALTTLTCYCGKDESSWGRGSVTVFVELPARMVYARNEDIKGSVRDDMIHKMGGNRREAELMAAGLRWLGFTDVREVPPVREKKWNQERFKLATGSANKTSEHERDAARLVIHYTLNWTKTLA
jgi:hypothetical protein